MGCNCGKPKCDGHCGVSPAVLQINNPSECTLFHRVEVPASMGDSKTNPPKNGAYKNVLLYYEADQTSWLYSSDGIPVRLTNGITNYEDAINLPQINGETLIGDKSSADLKLADAPMVITIATGNTSWSGADTAEDIYNFFLNQGKVNVVFEGSGNYGYEIVSAAYIPGEQKMMCMTTVAGVDTGSNPVEFAGNALYGLMTFYTVDKAVDVGELDLQPKLSITDFTGLNMTDGYVLEGVPATVSSIGMVKPGDGLSISSDGTLTVIDHVFDTVADMKASENLISGSYAQTLGYHTKNDGGAATYYITNSGTADEKSVVAVGTLYANLVLPTKLTPEAFGAYGDNTHDDASAIQALIEYAITSRSNIEFNKKTYKIGSTLVIDKSAMSVNLIIDGNGATIIGTTAINTEYLLRLKTPYSASYGQEDILIKNFKFNGNWVNKGIDIENTNFWSLENVNIQRCLYGLRLCNTYYGNLDDNCKIGNCWYGILFDDSVETNSNEVNTIHIGNMSLMMPSASKSNFDTELTTTVGAKIDTLINSVKFEGTVFEHFDIAMQGFSLRNSPLATMRQALFSVCKCYFENIGKVFEFTRQANNNYIYPIVDFSDNRVFPIGNANSSKIGELECGRWNILGNQNFTVKIGASPMNIELRTDFDDTYLDLTNITDTVSIDKIGLPRSTRDDEYQGDGYMSINRLLAIQNNNIIYHRAYIGNRNQEIKNYKAMSINAQNICFKQEGTAPVGLIINGDDGKRYMLGTDDGSAIKLIPMNNKSRYFQTANSKTALWLWNNRTRFETGTEFYCIDLERTVIKNADGNWYDKQRSYCAIGTSPVLYAHMTTNPQNIWWQQCWDVSFNRGVYYNVTKFDLGYDWFKNNDPHTESNLAILVYGDIASRPASPTYNSYYYAIDQTKYYYYDGSSWSEFTPSVS